MNTALDVLSIFVLLFHVVLATIQLERAVVMTFIIKPVIDTSWDISFGGLSIIEIHTVFILLIVYIYAFKNNIFRRNSATLSVLWVIAHAGFAITLFTDFRMFFEGIAQALFLPIGLVLVPHIYLKSTRRKLLLKYLFYAAIIPSFIIILQVTGVLSVEHVRMSKGLVRMNGFYHDIVTSRLYIFQGLVAGALLIANRQLTFRLPKILFLITIYIVASFFLYSKAMIGIYVIGLVLYLISYRNSTSLFITIIGLFIGLELFSSTVNQLFIVELGFSGTEKETSRLFSGRGGLWESYLEYFHGLGFLSQFFGTGLNTGGTHNELLRILILSGWFGLLSYCIFLIKLTYDIGRLYWKNTRVAMSSMFILLVIVLDTFSVVWGLYPMYALALIGIMYIPIIK